MLEFFLFSPICEDEEFFLEKFETSVWDAVSSHNVSFIEYVSSEFRIHVFELWTIQEICDENMQNMTYSVLDSDTEHVKNWKVTSF